MESQIINQGRPQLENLYEYDATIDRVIDGDSVVCSFDCGFGLWVRGEACRLIGIDTPEMYGDDRPAGEIAKQAVIDILEKEGNQVRVRTVKDRRGKYGRYLVAIWTAGSDTSLNRRLLDKGLAKKI